jgi:hypothetical protein
LIFNTSHVIPTSNLVERLFSKAKLVLTDDRKRMQPSGRSSVLTIYRDLWDERTVKHAIDDLNSERKAARAAAARTREFASASTAVAAEIEDSDNEEL